MGRGDRRTRRGKISSKSYGKYRPKKANKMAAAPKQ
ncbi:MAG: 30S ribosomal protein THX [Chitinophagales bacterium]|nr:30S ribosomal protein THX [Chitinophagales bacterium]HNI44549.1 30S ribosomal protein THX [Chitinophagales bacterium]HNL07065.1 30S ribosomal protein THX [Chitinophagales bacterium]